MMKFKKLSACLMGLGILGALTMPTKANALGWPVTDVELLAYMSGMTTGGAGVVELLTSINTALYEGNVITKNNEKNKMIAEDEKELLRLRNEATVNRIPDRAACVSASRASGGGGGAVNTTKSSWEQTQAMSETLENPTREYFKYEKELGKKKKIGSCSEQDVALKIAGCTQVGDYAGQDTTANSILFKPMTKQDIDSGMIPMGGLNQEEQEVRNQAIKVLVGVDALDHLKNPKQANTPEGARYMYNKNQQKLRKTLAQGVMQKNAAIEAQMKSSEASELLKELDWNAQGVDSPRAVWENVFGPKAKFPEVPSEWDILTYYVYSNYASTTEGSLQIRVASMTEPELLKSMVRMDAVNLRLQMLQVEAQKDTNNLLSAILSTMLENADDKDVEDMKKDVSLIVN